MAHAPRHRGARIAALAFAAGAATAAAVPASAATASPSYSYTSVTGDYLGQGDSKQYTSANADFTLENYWDDHTARLSVLEPRHGGPYAGTYWQIMLSPPAGELLHAGTYENATSSPYADDSVPGIQVSGEGRGCGITYGEFTIRSITYDPAGLPTHIDATVTAHCESPTAPTYTGVFTL